MCVLCALDDTTTFYIGGTKRMKNLLKLLLLALVAAMLVACGTPNRTETPTPPANEGETGNETEEGTEVLDGTKAVWDAEKGQYKIEDDAQIRLGVDNDALGAAIVALWDETHPEHAGKVTFENSGAAGSADRLPTEQDSVQDVLMVIDGEVSRNVAHTLALEENLAKLIKDNSLEAFYNAGNTTDQTVYAPVTYDGMAFVTNVTLLESLGLDTTDANGDNLVDAFDTWEEIFDLSRSYLDNRPTVKARVIETDAEGNQTVTEETTDTKLNVVFPMSLKEPWSGYFALTTGGWQLLEEGDALKPGYDKPEFKKGLEFLVEAKEAGVSVEESGAISTGESMTGRWDNVLNGVNLAPFGLVGTWHDVKTFSEETGNEYLISILPTYGDVNPSPFVKTKGFVINTYTKFQSASMELLRLIYSQAGLQAMVDNSAYAPSLADGSELTPDLTGKTVQEQFMSAFKYNYPEPAITLPENPGKKAMDAAYYGTMELITPQVWDGTLSVDDAIAELIETTNAKIEAENVAQ